MIERTELDAFGLLETETEANRGLLVCLVYKLKMVLKTALMVLLIEAPVDASGTLTKVTTVIEF